MLLLLGGLGLLFAMFGPALSLGGGDSLAGSGAQYALESGWLFVGRRSQRAAFSSKEGSELFNFFLNLLFLDLIADQRHLERCLVFCPGASCHAFSPGQEYHNGFDYVSTMFKIFVTVNCALPA